MLRKTKEIVVQNLQQVFSSEFACVFRTHKVNCEILDELRRNVKKAGGKVSCVRNTLAKKAIAGTPCECIEPLFKGVSFLVVPTRDQSEDTFLEIAKVFGPYIKAHPENLSMAGGVSKREFMDEAKMLKLVNLPTRLELLGQVAAYLQYPLSSLMNVLSQYAETKN